MEPYLSIVIPAYNEETRLPETLQRVREYLARQSYASEILVVDDGSHDQTLEAARAALAGAEPPVAARVIANDHRGKGYTVRTGMLAAAGSIVLFSDADLATPIEEVAKLLAQLRAGHDIAIGSREGVGAQRLAEPWYRHIMGRVFNMLVRLIAGMDYQDTQCGFKAFRRAVAQDLFSSMRLYGAGAKVIKGSAVTAFDVEILFLAGKRGYKVAEVPVVWHYGESTKVNPLRDSMRNFQDVARVRMNDWRGAYRA
jgi:glycosyltransferase involved in cell wall biosynthesis